jgi:hypothetical protein
MTPVNFPIQYTIEPFKTLNGLNYLFLRSGKISDLNFLCKYFEITWYYY